MEKKNKHASSKFHNIVVLDGVEYNTNVLAEKAEISRHMARGRLADFAKGKITEKELLHHGLIKKPKVHRIGKPTEEWQNMNRKEKCIEFSPGTWEKDHIKDRYVKAKEISKARADKKPQIKRRKKNG